MKRASGDLLKGSYLCIEIYIKIDYNTHLHIYIYLDRGGGKVEEDG